MILLTWNTAGTDSSIAFAIREFAIPVIVVEALIGGLAMASGLFTWLRQQCVPRFVRVCLAVWMVTALSTAALVAPGTGLSLFYTLFWALHLLFAISMSFFIARGSVQVGMLIWSLMAGFGLYVLLLAAFALQVDDTTRFDWVGALPGIGNIRRVAAYAGAAIGLGLGTLAVRRHPAALSLFVVCAGFFLAFWTGSRGALVAVFAGLIAAMILLRSLRTWRLPLFAALGGLVGLGLALSYPVHMEGNRPQRFVTDMSDNGRIDVWQKSIAAVKASPLIGYGEGQSGLVLTRDPRHSAFYAHPHNLLLQWLVAWGLIGTACLVALAAWLGVSLTRSATAEGAPFLLAGAILFVHSMFDGALFDLAPVYIFATCIGAAGGLAIAGRNRATGLDQEVPVAEVHFDTAHREDRLKG